MGDAIDFVVRGVPFGCVYGLLAVGLVLTLKTSGALNIAFAAQAYASGAVFYDLRQRNGWDIAPAVGLAVFVVGPALGALLYLGVFRPLRGAPAMARLVASIGLLVAIPEIVKLWFGSGVAFRPPSVAPEPFRRYVVAGYALDQTQLVAILVTLAAVGALAALFRWTAAGLRLRAVVESPRLSELHGVDADRVSALGWLISSLLAALAGVLIAPLFPQLNANNYTILLVAALAAVVIGGLSSISLAFLGGLLLGVLQQVIAGYLPLDSVLASGLRPSLPFVVLFAALLAIPRNRGRREVGDPLAAVEPPSGSIARSPRPVATAPAGVAAAIVASAVALVVALVALDDFWLFLVTQAVIYAVIFCSLTILVGMGGMMSLAQASLAGVGAFGAAQLAGRADVPVALAIPLAALVAAAVGMLLALPTVRLAGIYLSLATLAFAQMFDAVVVPLDWVAGTGAAPEIDRPVIGPVDFANDRSFLLLCVVALVVVAAGVVAMQRGTSGRVLPALDQSEPAALSIGINPARARVEAFAISAAVAGLGGGLLATHEGQASPGNFTGLLGLFWVAVVVTLGARRVTGAVAAGFALVMLPELLSRLDVSTAYQFVLFGLGTLAFARHPEGLVDAFRGWRVARRERVALVVEEAGAAA